MTGHGGRRQRGGSRGGLRPAQTTLLGWGQELAGDEIEKRFEYETRRSGRGSRASLATPGQASWYLQVFSLLVVLLAVVFIVAAVRQDLRRWDSFARQTRQNGNGTAEKGEGVGNGVKANRRRRGR